MRTSLLLLLALVACGDSNNKTVDAAVVADAPIDTAAAAPDPVKYCTDILAHCTGANAQYPTVNAALTMDQCLGTAATFPVGTAADTSGNTLGCRAYHAGAPAMGMPATHCIHAGPGGDQVDQAGTCGDPCTSFCTLDIKTCGSLDAPLTGITAQYQNMTACVAACANFNKTSKYALNGTPAAPSGDSLACRMYHATNAALYTKQAMMGLIDTHCKHTNPTPTGPCVGTAMP